MIDPALLDRLREADPDVYEEWKGMMITFPVIREGSRISDAWLQHVLQEAIRVRKWYLKQYHRLGNDSVLGGQSMAQIILSKPTTFDEASPKWYEGESPAEALLRAYLAAIGNRAWL